MSIFRRSPPPTNTMLCLAEWFETGHEDAVAATLIFGGKGEI